jgi:hypothetical protein
VLELLPDAGDGPGHDQICCAYQLESKDRQGAAQYGNFAAAQLATAVPAASDLNVGAEKTNPRTQADLS